MIDLDTISVSTDNRSQAGTGTDGRPAGLLAALIGAPAFAWAMRR